MKALVTTLLLVTTGGFVLSANAEPVLAVGTVLEGSITRYECGDSCYLTIMAAGGEEYTGLCAASMCESWNADAAIPDSMIGVNVRVTVGEGSQVDGEGNVMGTTDAFNEIELTDTDYM